ncbi:hypothetical protein NLG97_g10709 [Lecanicillium saksenae]|uniref:Uncharacterized protein n=1 Tax=Lecanicillium saksenae TaxID=468837 RepID=A0ACC1QCK9_9HYPO|nr:hypothetical protein NLG97_g10709 [Lecanicillium saksenae]
MTTNMDTPEAANVLLAGLKCRGNVHLVVGTNPLAAARCAQSLAAGARPILVAPAASDLHYGLQAKIDDGSVEPNEWTPQEAKAYETAVMAFIDGVELAERDADRNRFGHELSRRMRENWENGSFWYNALLRQGFEVAPVMALCRHMEPFCAVKPPGGGRDAGAGGEEDGGV